MRYWLSAHIRHWRTSTSGGLYDDEDDVNAILIESTCPDLSDMSQWFGEWPDVGERVGHNRKWCGGCTSSSVTARLALLRFARARCIEEDCCLSAAMAVLKLWS